MQLNPANPFVGPIEEQVPIENPIQDSISFIGVKVGDVNFSAILNLTASAEDRNTTLLSLEDQTLQAGETAIVPINMLEQKALGSLQMALRFDPSMMEIMSVEPGVLHGFSKDNLAQTQAGLLTCSWFDLDTKPIAADSPIFYLTIKAKRTMRLSEVLAFDQQVLRAEVYDQNDVPSNLAIIFSEKTTKSMDTAVFSLQPNPASDHAFIRLNIKADGPVRWSILDLDGKLRLDQSLNLEKGQQTLDLPLHQLPCAGTYLVRVMVGGEQFLVRLVKM